MAKSPYWVNNLYSIGYWLKKYAFYPGFLPLCNYIEHGCLVWDQFPPHEVENDSSVLLKFSPHLVNKKNEKFINKKLYCILNPLVFCRISKFRRVKNPIGTLYFPSHSNSDFKELIDWNEFIDGLKKVPDEYKPLDICLHHNDVVNGIDELFRKKGYKVFSAGIPANYQFAENFYTIIRNYKYTMSNDIGSHTFYCIEMGIPFSLYGQRRHLINLSDPNIEKGLYSSYNNQSFIIKGKELFSGFHKTITKEQKDYVDYCIGKTHSISRIKASFVLYNALFKYILIHPSYTISIIRPFFKKIKKMIYSKQGMRMVKKILKRISLCKRLSEIEKEEIQKKKELKRKILDYYSKIPKKKIIPEVKVVLKFLKMNTLSVIPYPFSKKYKNKNIRLYYDESKKLRYTLLNQKRMYLIDGGIEKDVKEYIRGLLIEQDIKSPHRYINNEFNIKQGDVVVDVGAAEGNFGLSVVDLCSHLFLFEAKEKWCKVLEQTFRPWKDKVTIINSIVSNQSVDNRTSLDAYFDCNNLKPNFIKIDAEGEDLKVIKGSKKIIANTNDLKIAVCTYHNQHDEEILSKELMQDFTINFSEGYMIFPYGKEGYNLSPPFFRKGVLRAKKSIQ